jgi:TPP-dependent pyruvate/acetoin dehydrogenase alpha subunit
MVTYRKYGHNIGDTGAARPPDEVAHWLGRDPIELVAAKLAAHGVAQARLEAVDAAVAARMENAIDAAAAMPEPPAEWAFENVYGDRDIIAAIGGGLR